MNFLKAAGSTVVQLDGISNLMADLPRERKGTSGYRFHRLGAHGLSDGTASY